MKKFVYTVALVAFVSATPAIAASYDPARHTRDDLALVQVNENDTQILQQALREAGFNKRPVTGYWDQNTTNALYSYQDANGLVPTGTLNNETLRQLGLVMSATNKVSGTRDLNTSEPRKTYYKKRHHDETSSDYRGEVIGSR
jgi:peptidoglycan hydrolase-like protein with peptidoglycan-binding domain